MPVVPPINTPYTPQSLMGALLIDAMEPWMTTHLAWYCDALGSMFDEVYGLVYDQGADGDPDYVPGYGSLLNPLLADPANLPYLGQFVGVQVPIGQDAATALALVTQEAGLNRGTLASLQSAITRGISNPWAADTAYVTGSPLVSYGNPAVFYSVTADYTSGATFGATDLANLTVDDPASYYSIAERVGSDGSAQAYWVTVRVRPEMLTPASSSKAILANINAILPGGILLNLVVSDSPEWSAATLEWTNVAGTVMWDTVASGQV